MENYFELGKRLVGERPTKKDYEKNPILLEERIPNDGGKSIIFFPPYLSDSTAYYDFLTDIHPSSSIYSCKPRIYGRREYGDVVRMGAELIRSKINPHLYAYSSGCGLAVDVANRMDEETPLTLIAPIINLRKKPLERAKIFRRSGGEINQIDPNSIFNTKGKVENPLRAFQQAIVNVGNLRNKADIITFEGDFVSPPGNIPEGRTIILRGSHFPMTTNQGLLDYLKNRSISWTNP